MGVGMFCRGIKVGVKTRNYLNDVRRKYRIDLISDIEHHVTYNLGLPFPERLLKIYYGFGELDHIGRNGFLLGLSMRNGLKRGRYMRDVLESFIPNKRNPSDPYA